MLTHLKVTNFQSLKNVDLELGTFTVIVGPSSSGKSALIRAFKALASNVRGTNMITRGEKAMVVSATTDTHVITLERLERAGSYRVASSEGSLTFTKLAGEVPPLVTKALRIDPVLDGNSVNFASQFDKPYLLDESGALVARVLGELTNVTVIFEAVRQANRIRAGAASTLKTRKADLEQLRTRLGAFQGLSGRLTLLEEAEWLDDALKERTARLSRLDSALRTVRIAERAIEKAAVPTVPSPDEFADLWDRYAALADARSRVGKWEQTQQMAHVQAELAQLEVSKAEAKLREVLAEAGVCPTCGQPIH
jgi:exonuclease SbcC